MKRFFALSALIATAVIGCNQTPIKQVQSLGAFEFAFDLEKKTVQVAPKLQANAVLTPTQISFTQGTLGYLSDVSSGVNYISATFNVNNLTASALSDVTLIAYKKLGNRAETALKSLVDFNNTPLTPLQLNEFAQAVQPTNMPNSFAPFVTNNNIADLQYFTEAELPSLETAANAAGELNLAGQEYMFPYGFVARSSNTSRSIAVGNNQGTVTIALKLPNSNEPTSGVTASSYPRRFNMTFVAMDVPVASRMSESYEERRGTSSAAVRAAAGTGFNIPSTNFARNTILTQPNEVQINGVRTSGISTNLNRILGERAWQLGTSGVDQARAVTYRGNNVYMAGSTTGGLDGNTTAGGTDFFVTKYDRNGAKQWTRQLGTTGSDVAYGVATDPNENVYVAGSTSGGLDGNTNAGSDDLFVTKYNSAGTKQWTRQLGTTGSDTAYGVATDPNGNVYVAGSTAGGLDGNTNTGIDDLFVTKYDSSGTKQWTRQLGTIGSDIAYRVATDSSSNIYVAGSTSGSLDGNTVVGTRDFFVTKYNSSGTKQWTRQLGAASGTVTLANDVDTDPNGNVYVAGQTNGPLDGNTGFGNVDFFVTKYDSSGAKQWTRQLGTAGTDIGYGVATDSSSNVYVSGYTDRGLDGNVNAGTNSVDFFVTKYDSSGTKQWTKQLGSTGSDIVFDIDTDPNGNIYVAGNTSASFGGETNSGNTDILLVRFDALTNIYK